MYILASRLRPKTPTIRAILRVRVSLAIRTRCYTRKWRCVTFSRPGTRLSLRSTLHEQRTTRPGTPSSGCIESGTNAWGYGTGLLDDNGMDLLAGGACGCPVCADPSDAETYNEESKWFANATIQKDL